VDDVLIERADGIGIVRLNRPDRGNSVTPAVVTELGDTVEALCADDAVRAVVLTGTGVVFCAGADVQEMYEVYRADGPDGLMTYLAEVWMPAVQRTVRRLWVAPKPTVAAFNGAATAGGLDFGLTCDVRIAASTARFAESYVNLGMVPVAGGAYLLPSLVGRSTATRLLASGRLIGAEEAERIGLVDEVCAPEELGARARALAEELGQGPMATFAHTKRVVRLAAISELEKALEESLQANIDLIARGDVRDRIVAVMERFSS
jgi:2-(1,2-epoxy-1,2-dihydrophenyl)acetyl-CoA isomerase